MTITVEVLTEDAAYDALNLSLKQICEIIEFIVYRFLKSIWILTKKNNKNKMTINNECYNLFR